MSSAKFFLPLVLVVTLCGFQTYGIPTNPFNGGHQNNQTCEADLIMVLDSTQLIDEEYFLITKEFTKTLSMFLTSMEPAPPRLSLMTYREYYSTIVPLPANATLEQLEAAHDAIPYLPGGVRRTDAALDGLLAEFSVHSSRNASKVFFMIVNAVSADPVKTIAAANRVKDAGISGIVLPGDLEQVDQEELLAIVGGNPDHILTVASYEPILNILAGLMCP